MRWSSTICGPNGLSEGAEGLEHAIKTCSEELKTGLEGQSIDLLIGFVSPHFMNQYDRVPEFVSKHLSPKVFIGCSAGGLIGGGQEIENERCVAFTAAHLPDVKILPFHVTDKQLPDLDDPPDKWEQLVHVKPDEEPSFIILPDPFSFTTTELVIGLDYAFPNSVKVGGLASGANSPGHNVLFQNDQVHRQGLVGVAVTGNLIVDTVVAQGCKPVGKPYRVTKCEKNMLLELDGKPAVYVLKDVLEGLTDQERELLKHAVFLGIVMNEHKEEYHAGDFLVRNILGIVPSANALVVGELLHNERTVQFHVRDAATSAEDLRLLLKRYKDEKLDGGDKSAKGALLFSCLGRGELLYGQANHDSDCFRSYLGPVPLGGFFCNGEIGPVGETTFLHGYTSSFGIFRPKENETN